MNIAVYKPTIFPMDLFSVLQKRRGRDETEWQTISQPAVLITNGFVAGEFISLFSTSYVCNFPFGAFPKKFFKKSERFFTPSQETPIVARPNQFHER